jgi:arginine kinase
LRTAGELLRCFLLSQQSKLRSESNRNSQFFVSVDFQLEKISKISRHEQRKLSSDPFPCFHSSSSSSQLEKKREDFRRYLDSAGAIDNLTKALIKLYEQTNKPTDAVKFLRKHMCESCPDEEQFEALVADLEQANKKICELERELSRIKGSVKRSTSEVELALVRGFEELNVVESKSPLQKFLTKSVLDGLKSLKTSFRGNLLDCVQAGLDFLDSPLGIFACDGDAYTVFASLFDPLIEELHGFKRDDKQPTLDWGEPCKLPELDGRGDKIISIRVRCCRSIESFPFASIMSMEQYEEIMSKLQQVAKRYSGDLRGKFHALEGMEKELKKALIDDGVMFGESSSSLKAANGARFWPTGRGVFVNEAKSFVVWCNEEDHLRFISRESGGNLSENVARVKLFAPANSSYRFLQETLTNA